MNTLGMNTRGRGARLSGLGVAALLAMLPSVALAQPEIQHWTSRAGVAVYFVSVSELPIVDIQLRFTRSGHAHEGDRHGLASMTASLLHQGAGGMDVDQIADHFSRLGARSGASADADSSQVSLRSLSDPQYFDQAFETWIKVVSAPDFPMQQFERQRKNVLTEIERKRQNPSDIAAEAFNRAIYGDHPYAHAGLGSEQTIAALTLNDVRAFYQKHYVTSNLIITMVGAISRTQAAAIADRVSGALKPGEPATALPPAAALKEAVTVRIPFPSEQAHVRIGQPAVHSRHPDIYALRLGNDILGGSGFGSRLLEEIRVKRGFAYSAYSYLRAPLSTGVFGVSFQTRIDQADEAVDAAREVLQTFVSAGPKEEEVMLTLDRIRGGSVFRVDSNQRILSTVSAIAFHQLPLDYLYNYVLKYEQEDRESVTQAYQKHLHPDKLVTVIVGGPAQSVP